MTIQSKIEKYIDRSELPQFLRELADAIESGNNQELACASDFKRFKLTVKNEYGKMALKAKFKSEKECKFEEDEQIYTSTTQASQYKILKKRMKSSFKLLFKLIHDGQIPPDEAVQSFLEDSNQMVTYPGYGDEYYESDMNVCNEFKGAYEARDIPQMTEAMKALAYEKGRCHTKYD